MSLSLKKIAQQVIDSGRADGFVRSSLETIDALEPKLGCLISSDRDSVEQQLKELQERLDGGETDLTLAGVPIVVKDNICVRGQTTTCGSKMLERFVPPYSATVWERLKRSGAILVGKSNMDEFAMGSTTERSVAGPTRNPWDVERTPGGSSGGSAAAVSAGYVPVALGSDTGGSIRQPSALCGVTGLKPTYGFVSRYGLVSLASSLDHIGPIGRTAEDIALVLSCIAGYDPHDATSTDQAVPPNLESLGDSPELTDVKFALPMAIKKTLPAPIWEAFEQTIEEFRSLGILVEEVDLPHLEDAMSAYHVICAAEASSNLGRYDGVRYAPELSDESFENISELTTKVRSSFFGPEVKRRILLGTHVLSSGHYERYYDRALRVRRAVGDTFQKVFEDYTAVLTPTTPGPATKLGENQSDPIARYYSHLFTIPANLTGLPAISIPSGTHQGLPLGAHLIGAPFSELNLLTLCRDYQKATTHHLERPGSVVHG